MEELVKEQPVYEIQKVKIKNNQLTAEYTEKFVEANYKNNILKESEQFIHQKNQNVNSNTQTIP